MNYLAVVYNERKKKIEYEEIENVDDEISNGDVAICIINILSSHQKLINFWPLWGRSITDIK